MRPQQNPAAANRHTRFGVVLAIIVTGATFLAATLPLAFSAASKSAAPSLDRTQQTVGANACAECHTKEADLWKETRHHKTFRQMPRSKAARRIAGKLGIKRIKAEPLCRDCHFTTQAKSKREKVVSGISCESCHGAGRDWIKVHSEYSGKGKKAAESEAEAKVRWAASVTAGMIRKDALYDIAKNCYSCHVVPNERLVNIGGHPAGSAFELVSWSQGEIRHNVWYNKGKDNPASSKARQRVLYLVGLAMELETALRAIAIATEFKEYAIRMAHRANAARKALREAAEKLPDVSELEAIVAAGHSAGLKLGNKQALDAAADRVAQSARTLEQRHNGGSLAAIDPLIPPQEKFVGSPAAPK